MINLGAYARDVVRQVVGTAHMTTDRLSERERRVYARMRVAVVPCLGCGREHRAVDLSVGDCLCPECRPCQGEGQDLSNPTEGAAT